MNLLFLSLGRMENMKDKGIYTDLLREFNQNGHEVYVVSPREKRYGLPTELIVDEGIHSLKVRIGNIKKVNNIEKGLSTLYIQKQYIKAIKQYYSNVKFDLVLYTTPPITFVEVVKFIKNRDKAKTYLLLKDIFPQNAVDLKMFNQKGLLYKYFRNEERNLYKVSDFIGTMSPANKKYVLDNNPEIPKLKVEVCPNTITPSVINISELQKQDIKQQYGIPLEKTLFIYGGNLGKPQGIDFLIDCIKMNEKNKGSFILIVGSGTEFNRINKYFNEFNPKNSKLISSLPKKEYEILANSADVGLIFLDNRFTIPNFPSRLLSYMQASIPVIAATDQSTDIGKIITDGEFGFFNSSDDVDAFDQNVKKMLNKDKRIIMGKNARLYLEKYYTSKNAYDIIISHI